MPSMAVHTRRSNFLPHNIDSVNQEEILMPMNPCDSHQIRSPSRDVANTESFRVTNIGTRKRNRDSESQFSQETDFCFSGVDVLPHIQQSQLEIDAIFAYQMKKLRLGLQEKQRQHLRILAAAMLENQTKMLSEKEDQFQRMVKLNLVLQEKVKNAYTDIQIRRNIAETNKSIVDSLRRELNQALLNFRRSDDVNDDGESVCSTDGSVAGNRLCKKCGVKEACVVVLPCRHLCLCNFCGGGSYQLGTCCCCPVCNCTINAILHVNTFH